MIVTEKQWGAGNVENQSIVIHDHYFSVRDTEAYGKGAFPETLTLVREGRGRYLKLAYSGQRLEICSVLCTM